MDLPTRLALLRERSLNYGPTLETVHYVVVTTSPWQRHNLRRVLRNARKAGGAMVQHDQMCGRERTHEIVMTARVPVLLTAIQLSMRWSRGNACIS